VEKMVDIQNKFLEKIAILTPNRRLIRRDTFYVYSDGEEKKMRTKKDFLRQIFLLNDLFIIAKPVKDEKLSLVKMCATEALNYSDMAQADGLHRFFIGSEIAGQPTYVCATTDENVKIEWKKQLKAIRDQVVKRRMAKEKERKALSEQARTKLQNRLSMQTHQEENEPPFSNENINTSNNSITPTNNEDSNHMIKSPSFSEYLSYDILEVRVEDSLLQDKDTRNYFYSIDVYYPNTPELLAKYRFIYPEEKVEDDECVVLTTYKSFDDFVQLHIKLIRKFPEEAGLKQGFTRVLPELPPQQMFVSYSTAKARAEELDNYLQALMSLPEKLTKSEILRTFLKTQVYMPPNLVRVDSKPQIPKRRSIKHTKEQLSSS